MKGLPRDIDHPEKDMTWSARGSRRQQAALMVLGTVLVLACGYAFVIGGTVVKTLAIVGICAAAALAVSAEYALLWKPDRPARADDRRHLRDITLGLVAYLLLMLLVWPRAMHLESGWLKAIGVLLPVVPFAWVVRTLLRVVMGGDELEQRIHLQALGIAAGVVGLGSLALGLLAIAKMVDFSALALVMVVPALLLVHCGARLWLRRRYRDA
jgi:hypothetical protein